MKELIKKLYQEIFTIPKDKLLHFIAGVLIFMLFSPFIGWLAIWVVIVVAIIKEIIDTKNTGFSYSDIVATELGAAVTMIYMFII